MTQQLNSKGEQRAAHTMRLLENAKRSVQPESGALGVFMRVTLAIIFMYLIVASYLMLDIAGPVFISILFLAALFTPHLYTALKSLMEKRKAQKISRVQAAESRQ